MHIAPLTAAEFDAAAEDLITVLRACVDAGASIGYLAPMPHDEAAAYWESIRPAIAAGTRLVLVAREGSRIVGTGQLAFETRPNGRHRAEVCKVLVLPSHRGRGIGSEIMRALERHARERRLRLLHLDTSEGRSGATRLYESLGYTYAGGIPEWALDPDRAPAKNAIYYKLL